MNNFKLNPGTIFICGIDGETVPIGQNGIPYFDDPIGNETDERQIAELMIDAAQEISFSIKTSKNQIDRLLQSVLRITDTVLDIASEKHARVVYLAKHGKKARTRKKNVRRAYRIVQKEG